MSERIKSLIYVGSITVLALLALCYNYYAMSKDLEERRMVYSLRDSTDPDYFPEDDATRVCDMCRESFSSGKCHCHDEPKYSVRKVTSSYGPDFTSGIELLRDSVVVETMWYQFPDTRDDFFTKLVVDPTLLRDTVLKFTQPEVAK